MKNEKKIYVYADFLEYDNELIGVLYESGEKGREIYSFEYDENWLKKEEMILDPDLSLFRGRQYLKEDKKIFGLFADSCPDRWGRILMDRRELIRANNQNEKPKKLSEKDYLLGVYDESRMGGIRFKTEEDGEFVSYEKDFATPPWTSLRKLEEASRQFEKDENKVDEKWIRQLIAPGSSLGGARPKASVVAPDETLWIAKFPSKNDDYDVGAWEMVVHDLAELCKLNVPSATIEKFSNIGSTFLVQRFDRNKEKRIHFASAMTMLGKQDGADAREGNSYLEIVSFLKANGVSPKEDIRELWKRIVFSMLVSNTDDHFRNHGFILERNGWKLSPVYDINPNIYGEHLTLNVDDVNSNIDLDLVISSAYYYGIEESEAKEIVEEFKIIIRDNWKKLAKNYGVHRSEIEYMKPAFRECEN